MRLFQLVEQHKTVGPAAHTFGQLAALVVADVARRRADKARDREFFHIFRHIHADHRVLAAVDGLGQRLAQLRLADTRRPEEQHGRRRALLLGKPASPAPHGLCRGMDGLLLPDDAGGERLLQRAQALPLRPGDRPDGNARAARNGCGDVLYGDRPAGLAAPPQTVAQGGGPLVFSGAHGGLQGLLLLRRAAAELAHARMGRALVEQVHGLVGQKFIRQITARQLHGGGNGFLRDGDMVVRLQTGAQPGQDLARLLRCRLTHLHRTEAPLQRGVLFDAAAVFAQRRRADKLQFAAAECGLEQVGRIDGALRRTGPDEGVHLVDKQDDVLHAPHLGQNVAHALLKFTAVLCACDDTGHVQRVKALAAQWLRHGPGGKILRHALHDGRLADARLADEGGIVLVPPREDLQDGLDLLPPADDRLLLSGALEHIHAKLIQQSCVLHASLLPGKLALA